MNERQPRGTTERLIDLSKAIDKVGIIGGVAIGLTINPVLGGMIAGGSIVTHEAGTRIETGLRSRREKKLGALAVKS